MTTDAPQGLGLCRFQIQRDRDGKYRWSVFNTRGTRLGTHPEGFETELDARRDAERHRSLIGKAPIIGTTDMFGVAPSG